MFSEEEIKTLAFKRWGITLRREGRQLLGPCPFCHEGQRSIIFWQEGNGWCHRCFRKVHIRDNQKDWHPEPQDAEKMKQRLVLQADIQRKALAAFQAGPRPLQVVRWHQEMETEHIVYWRTAGMRDEVITEYQLGFTASKQVDWQDQRLNLSAYTIPIRNPRTGLLENVQYRLNNVPRDERGKEISKYRQERGLDASMFWPKIPQCFEEPLVLVEGAKKGLVVAQLFEWQQQVAGLPGIAPSPEMMEQLKPYREIFLVPDPDAIGRPAVRIAKYLSPRVRLVRIPVKIDDAIVLYNASKDTIYQYLTQGEPIL